MASVMLLFYLALIVAAIVVFYALSRRRAKASRPPGSLPLRVCAVCGTRLGGEDRFCARCGSPLPEA